MTTIYLSVPKLQKMDEELREMDYTSEEIDRILGVVTRCANFHPEKYLAWRERHREQMQVTRKELRESGCSTYSQSARDYYERNKAALNKKRVQQHREKRERARAGGRDAAAAASTVAT